MALIKCEECGKDISSKSNKCVHCGIKIHQPGKRAGEMWVAFILIIIILAAGFAIKYQWEKIRQEEILRIYNLD
jgi:hypothetical protein